VTNRVVITFAALDHRALPWLVEGEEEAEGTPVPLPEGLTGVIHNPPVVIRESAGGPDLWTAIQVIVEHGDKIATGLVGTLLAAWIKKRLDEKAKEPATPAPPSSVTIDQSVHTIVHVFIGKVEVGADPDKIESAVRDDLEVDTAPIELPPRIRRDMAAVLGITEEAFEEWTERD
jgi:hypothetical protein